jgi:pyridoxine 5-phosphate synthase
MTLLGVNIDHVATVRQQRKEGFPDPVQAAEAAVQAGATGITAHLREDRRHIQDDDIRRLKAKLSVPLNLEMAASDDILKVAESVRPAWACLVPEKRQELTTEGGLDVVANEARLRDVVARLHRGGTKVSMFIDATTVSVDASRRIGADAVEIHTGTYARKWKEGDREELAVVARAAVAAKQAGLIVNAGHGIDYENVGDLLEAFPFHELNIGFSIVSRALMVGIGQAVREMKERMANVCAES